MRIVCAIILIIGLSPFLQADWWVIAIGRLEVAMREAVYTETYGRVAPTTSEFTGRISAQETTRAEAESRVSQAIEDLCQHDLGYCAAVFEQYGLRWRQP